jgi:hypothetical protein
MAEWKKNQENYFHSFSLPFTKTWFTAQENFWRNCFYSTGIYIYKFCLQLLHYFFYDIEQD